MWGKNKPSKNPQYDFQANLKEIENKNKRQSISSK